MSLPEWFAHLALENPDLYRAIYDFNLRPQHWIHPERLSPLPYFAVFGALAGSTAAGAFLARQLEINDPPEWDFTGPQRRLALLPCPALERLARFAGALVHWQSLSKLISKKQIQQIRENIGQDAYSFALRRGRAFFPVETLQIPVPSPASDNSDSIMEAGWVACAIPLSNESASIVNRFRLKIPPRFDGVVKTGAADEIVQRFWNFIRKVAQETLTTQEKACFF